MKPQDTEQTNRLRTILQRMERSIDDARARRVDGPGRPDAVSPPPASPITGGGRMPLDPLDTPIADTKQTEQDFSKGSTTVRDAGTMFDFKGPRLKARPKRSNDA
ncbi:MAG: hypothetical protein GY728_09670 [Phycisphaeraceae bacterium]|nr:hypothetical protein [Phycisphaerae bacterium]MCP4013366.1 hypothetical protein [Phycisphaeraceae bacterium]HAC09303.1 hypothetical protein [Phycisphaerales bacterium]MCP4068350.1 hypothetical protein [Phycisphaeraceae bacterium]MCP4496507.1 hypothetical protein [Phycisphaeraceae bacterium]|tara:strand:+ start:225 stop:539 length:315 start_codon:yes stop_codon:yes gene_type:complete